MIPAVKYRYLEELPRAEETVPTGKYRSLKKLCRSEKTCARPSLRNLRDDADPLLLLYLAAFVMQQSDATP